ncbi:MAG: hypothetical protein ACUVRZ_10320 [Desulfobacca sp.]|uniref:hypothetical protein n=1 Tax=Desulfobacca sp. TaxID=2067990 RepID=UPI00404B6924
MKPTPFDVAQDLPPLPFDGRHCEAAARLKGAGLPWHPHVGCFVWDRDVHLPVPSPFPQRIYFILNLGHFVRLLGSEQDIAAKLIWLPTWHQARLLAQSLGVSSQAVAALWRQDGEMRPGEELLALYELLQQALMGTT